VGDSRVHDEKDFSANAEQMRLRMRAMIQPMSGLIVASADQILAGTSDPAVRRAALVWKIQAVPALREALFQPNPKTALLDAWVFTFQMCDYFETGPGAASLGEAHGIALATAQQLEMEMSRVATSMTYSGDITSIRAFAHQWAFDHPMASSIAGRESTLSLITQKNIPDAFAAPEAMGSLVVSIDDLNRRLEIYTAQLPDHTRWQGELLAMDAAEQYALDRLVPLAERSAASAGRAVDALDRTLLSFERSLSVLEKAPAMVTAEREATIKALSTEISRTIAFAQEERLAILKQLSVERVAMVQEVDKALAEHRASLARGLEEMGTRAVDYTFYRAAQLGAVMLLAVLLGLAALTLLVKWIFSPPHTPVIPRPLGPAGKGLAPA
jgi:hypothetical protein